LKEYEVKILSFAYEDIKDAKIFYQKQEKRLADYFQNTILSDIQSLSFQAGIHYKTFGFYRKIASKFPYAIYYDIFEDEVFVFAVLDLRANPEKSIKKLKDRK